MLTFKKSERLCSKKDIGLLYTSGKHKTIHPLKIYWRPVEPVTQAHVRVVISVPKRQFKKAVDRNRIRRQIKEVYRLNKNSFTALLKEKLLYCDLMILFLGKSHPGTEELEKALLAAFAGIARELEASSKRN